MKRISQLVFLALISACSPYKNFVKINPTDTPQDIVKKASMVAPTERQLQWQKLDLTAFIHFGINTFTDREWGTGKESPTLFNPTKLDAEQWVKTLKDAGFKQVIITAKHHDGFCLWPTKTTPHSVKNSPWKNGNGDVVKEVAAACKKFGVGFGVYLSPWDMNAPQYGTDSYNRFFEQQLTELLTNYGEVNEVWFDGANGEGPNGKKQEYDFQSWYGIIRKLQPKAVIAVMGPDVRWVGTETGRGRIEEWSVVPMNNMNQGAIAESSQKGLTFKPEGDLIGDDIGSREKILDAKGLIWYPAETDVSIRPGWFYHENQDDKVKTPQELWNIYLTSVGRNSVLLLNVPPNKDGLFADADIVSLRGFSEIIKDKLGNNLIQETQLKSADKKALSDGNLNSAIQFKNNSTLDLNFKNPTKVSYLVFQEDITKGQRVEKFRVEGLVNGSWQNLAEGKTIGYKRILKLENPAEVQQLRFVIEQKRNTVFMAEVGIY